MIERKVRNWMATVGASMADERGIELTSGNARALADEIASEVQQRMEGIVVRGEPVTAEDIDNGVIRFSIADEGIA